MMFTSPGPNPSIIWDPETPRVDAEREPEPFVEANFLNYTSTSSHISRIVLRYRRLCSY